MSKINKYLPYYDRRKRKWRVEFPDAHAEEGDLFYVACEYAHTSLYFPYNTTQTKDKEWDGHSHSIDGVIHSLLEDPEGFTIEGFEEYYSKQERDFLAMLQSRIRNEKA